MTWSSKARPDRMTENKIQYVNQVQQLESAKVRKNKGDKQTRKRRVLKKKIFEKKYEADQKVKYNKASWQKSLKESQKREDELIQ